MAKIIVMNSRPLCNLLSTLGLTSLALLLLSAAAAAPLGTAFTYQGRLTDGNGPAHGLYDLRFTLFDAPTDGVPTGTPSVVTTHSTPVSNGLFAVSLDFGPAFTAEARWLSIEVKTNLASTYQVLNPRTEITATPQALYAARANVANGVAPGSVTSAGLAPGSVNGATIANGTVGIGDLNSLLLNDTFWRLNGNNSTTPGTSFLGTIDNQPLELRVNNRAAFRLQPNSGTANLVGGHPDNSVGAGLTGSFIGGGGAAAESRNRASSNYTAVVGGYGNTVDGNASLVGGGAVNTIATDSHAAVIVGGSANNIRENSSQSIIGGGNFNSVSNASLYATIAGGTFNRVGQQVTAGAIGGGSLNVIGDSSRGSTVAGGESNQIGTNSPGGTIGGGRINVIAANTQDTTISGGTRNEIGTNSYASTISGGGNNEISSNALACVIGGGSFNTVGYASTHATIAGGGANAIDTNSFGSAIGGGSGNRISTNSQHATIAGGRDHRIGGNAAFSVIGGGYGNTNVGSYAIVPGGTRNFASGSFSLAAGYRAKALHEGAFVWADSQENDFASTLANQVRLRAGGGLEVIGGSSAETMKFSASRAGDFTTPVGLAINNNNSGNSSPALRVANLGGNSVDGALSVSASGTGFIAKFGNSSSFVSSLAVNGTWSGLAFNSTSDRAAKENFSPVNPQEVLEKVASLPLARWTYKAAPGIEHLGPISQDFHAAFGLNGDDNRHIATVDADGVALAAIQGLNAKVERQTKDEAEQRHRLETRLRQKDAEIAELKASLDTVKQLVDSLHRKINGEPK